MLGEPPSGTVPRPVNPIDLPMCARVLKSSILCRKGALLFKRCDGRRLEDVSYIQG